MSNNEEDFTEEDAFEEMGNTYQLEVVEYDENEEGTVEYLDLDLEVDSIRESTEDHIPFEASVPRTVLGSAQSSVLKTSYVNAGRGKQKQRVLRAKQTQGVVDNIVGFDSLGQAVKKNADDQASAAVHAAVNAINLKLADSAQSTNSQRRSTVSNERLEMLQTASNEDFVPCRVVRNGTKTESADSLDLFFQSMAQTVLKLPSQVQAKIKMDICKVIAMAEIKYCTTEGVPNAN